MTVPDFGQGSMMLFKFNPVYPMEMKFYGIEMIEFSNFILLLFFSIIFYLLCCAY